MNGYFDSRGWKLLTAEELKNKEAEDDEAELDREEDAVEEDDEEEDDEGKDNDEVPASPQMLPMSSSPCTRFTATLISASVSPNVQRFFSIRSTIQPGPYTLSSVKARNRYSITFRNLGKFGKSAETSHMPGR